MFGRHLKKNYLIECRETLCMETLQMISTRVDVHVHVRLHLL